MKQVIWAIFVLFLASNGYAGKTERYLEKFRLESGETVVVAEGDFEARSIGSFSIRIYEAGAEGDDTTFFLSGTIHSRDGAVEKVVVDQVNDNARPDIIVISRSVGTGSYQSAYIFEYFDNSLKFLFSKEGVSPDDDMIALVKNELKISPQ